MSIVKIREKYQVTIPQDVREKIPCEVGEYVRVEAEDEHIVIRPTTIEEKFSKRELDALEKVIRDPKNQGVIMSAEEFREHLEEL